jgi:hypothetical protein
MIDFYTVWIMFRGLFHLVAELLAVGGLGEWGGRVMAALLFAAFFFLAGVFKKTRRVVGLLLAALFVFMLILAAV